VALVECEVIGPLPIVDAVTGRDVVKGGRVVLDEERTVIRALIESALVGAPAPYEPPKPPKGKDAA
jgi:hypothetical protein